MQDQGMDTSDDLGAYMASKMFFKGLILAGPFLSLSIA
jgi:hypothetical protein